MNRIVLARFSGASMPDKPGKDWHHRVQTLIGELAADDDIGGSLTDLSWTLGPYDAVIRVDMPSDQATAAFSLTLSRKLRAETTTLTALAPPEMDSAMQFADRMNGPGP